MEHIEYAQMGAGGLTWLIFLAGLLWCNFAWWRANRCKRSLLSMVFATIATLGIMAMAAIIAAVSTGFINPRTLNGEFVESVALGSFVMMGVCWAMSSISFLLAAIANGAKSNPQPRG